MNYWCVSHLGYNKCKHFTRHKSNWGAVRLVKSSFNKTSWRLSAFMFTQVMEIYLFTVNISLQFVSDVS